MWFLNIVDKEGRNTQAAVFVYDVLNTLRQTIDCYLKRMSFMTHVTLYLYEVTVNQRVQALVNKIRSEFTLIVLSYKQAGLSKYYYFDEPKNSFLSRFDGFKLKSLILAQNERWRQA